MALGIFIFIQIGALLFHEPWVDEIQAWLLARDSGLVELLTKRVRYEPVPGLWHAFLWLGSRFSNDLIVLNICGSLIATLSCVLILFFSPLPLWIRLFLPFSYFFGYQYAVVARNYCLTTLGMLLAAIIYPKRFKHPFFYVLALLIVANSASHGILIASAIALSDFPLRKDDVVKRASLLKASPVFILGILAAILQIFPRPLDVYSTPPPLGTSGWQILLPSLDESLLGIPQLSIFILVASVWLFYKANVLFVYLLSCTLLESFFVSTYWMTWHSGLLFLVWIFCIFQCYQKDHPLTRKTWWKLTMAIFLLVSVFQTFDSVREDVMYPFSGLKEVAGDLNRKGIEIDRVVYIEFHGQMLRGYFQPTPSKPSYWVFSDPVTQPWTLEHCYFSEARIIRLFNLPGKYIYPEYVLTHDNISEETIKRSGYSMVRHYPGSMIWRGRGRERSGFYLISPNQE